MKANLRLAMGMTIAIAGVVIGWTAIWFAGVEHGRLLELQSRQTLPAAAVRPVKDMGDARLFSGYNVFVAGQLADRYSLGKFVEERSGQLRSHLDADTDYVLMPVNAGSSQFSEVVAEAKELHIPVGDQSKLLRLAQLQ